MNCLVLEKYPPFLPPENYSLISSVPDDGFYLREIDGIWHLFFAQQELLHLDFSSAFYRARGGVEYLPKAFKNCERIFDATAGFGRDSWLLAYRGKNILLCERNPYLATLLLQAKFLSERQEKILAVGRRIEIIFADSREYLSRKIATNFDAIYLDPMYPEKKKNAAVKKEMQILHRLLGVPDLAEQERLFFAAIESGVEKIVVKRPSYACELSAKMPENYRLNHTVNAVNTRYLVYMRNLI